MALKNESLSTHKRESMRIQTTLTKAMYSNLRSEAKRLSLEDENDVVRFILARYFGEQTNEYIF